MTRLGYQIPNFTYPNTQPHEIFANVVAQAKAAESTRGVRPSVDTPYCHPLTGPVWSLCGV